MPLIRKLINLRTTKAVCLPKDWLDFLEKQHGVEVKEVGIEVDNVLTIIPIIPDKEKEKEKEKEE